MTNERKLFFELLDLDSEEARRAFLERVGEQDPELRERLVGLLAASGEAGEFLAGHAVPVAGEGLVATQRSEPLAEGPGTVIGRYKLLQKIGEGGFGVVYMAEQREPVKRRVALKIIKLGMDTRQVVGRFEVERQALAMMDHPNIAKVLDGGATENGRPYFVMELVKGVPITEYCDENNLTTGERLQLFMKVCAAVQHAHQRGVIHRDLKPGNVLVTQHDDQPVPKVIDFGIAKAMQQELTEITIFTRYQEFVGTPAYMSPEQAQFSGLDIDTRTDIYSLGVLLYELLTGRTPFDAKELLTAGYEEMRRRIREDDPIKPSTRVKTLAAGDLVDVARRRREKPEQLGRMLRGDLDWIVMQALEKDRARRYESAGALARDIERFLHDEPVNAAAPSALYRLRKFTARHQMAMGVAALIVVLLVAGIVGTTYQMIRASNAELLALRYLNEERKKAVAMELAQHQRDVATQRAEREAAVAAAVVKFLNEDLFAEAAPFGANGQAVTYAELVQRAQRQIDERFAREPLVEAAVRQTLATTLNTLGDAAGARKQAETAFQIRQEQLGPDSRETLESMIFFAYLVYRDDWERGRALAEEAMHRAETALGKRHPVTLDAMSRLARIYWGHADTKDQCRELAAEVVTLAREVPEVIPETYIRALQLHGRMTWSQGGESYFREAVQYAVDKLGAEHPRTITARASLAGFLYDRDIHLAEAEQLCRDALNAYGRLFGETHPNSIIFRDNLRLILRKLNRWDDAVYQGLKILQLSDGASTRLDMVRSDLGRAPLMHFAGVTADRALTWTVARAVSGRDWSGLDFDASEWQTELPAGAAELWLRGEFKLTEVGQAIPVFKLPPAGEFTIRINGVRANRLPPHRDTVEQVLVPAERAVRALRVGSNVFAIEARHLDPSRPLDIKVLALPEAESVRSQAERLAETP